MKYYLYLCLLILATACAPSRFVAPLAEGEQALNVHLGGSLIDYSGSTIPVPLSSITYAKGMSEKLTVFGGLHTTSLAFNNLQLEAGLVSKVLEQKGWQPALSSAIAFNLVTELSEGNTKLWPQVDGNAYWQIKQHRPYLGYAVWIDPNLMDENALGVLNPHIGYTYTHGEWDFNTELKFLAPGYDNSKVFVPYKSLQGDKGATGVYLSISKRF
jgi:hypothetical protein